MLSPVSDGGLGGGLSSDELRGQKLLMHEQRQQSKLFRRITKQKTLRLSMGGKASARGVVGAAMASARKKATEMDAAIARSEYELKQRALLVGMFEIFDKDGGGTITLREMLRTFERELGLKDPETKQRLQRHFEFMDRDGNGSIDFKEFEHATLGQGHERFKTLKDEKDNADHGNGLYLLLQQLKRKRISREARKLAKMGKPIESFAVMSQLVELDMFAVDMEHAEDGAKHDGKKPGEKKKTAALLPKAPAAQTGARMLADATMAAAAGQPRLTRRREFRPSASMSMLSIGRMQHMQREQAALTRQFGKNLSSTRLPAIGSPGASFLMPPTTNKVVRVPDATELRRRRRRQIARLGGSTATSMMF
jgi:hypothetical protein